MSRTRRGALLARFSAAAVLGAALLAGSPLAAAPAQAESYVPISGTGSTWAQSALDEWRKQVSSDYGMTINYSGTGSSSGRRDFIAQTADFAVSELPFQAAPEDGSAPEVPTTAYTYLPIVAGGTSFLYNLRVGGQQVTNLRLSGQVITKIFTGAITNWNDPAIRADNPGLGLPDKPIVPVVRSDGSGSTAQFTRWMSTQHPDLWEPYFGRSGFTSQYPVSGTMKAQNGSLGVAGYVSQSYGEGAITYVEYSYAQNAGFPVAKVLNAAGYYVAPTASAVAIGISGAQPETDPSSVDHALLQLDGVYSNPDPRAYPLSSVSYMILPTETNAIVTQQKGATLGAFGAYALCLGQQKAEVLGYAPLPMNLVQQGLGQLARVPGATPASIDGCANPTFVAGDTVADSLLTRTAPMPPESDRTDAPGEGCAAGVGAAGEVSLCVQTTTAVDAPLSLQVPANAAADFAPPQRVNGLSFTVGELPEFTVDDGRVVSHPGWDLLATIADYRNAADASIVIPSLNAGLAPAVTGSLDAGVTAGPGERAGSAHYPTVFATAAEGSGVGDTVLAGQVSLLSPPDRPAGTYHSTMTLTLVSR
ncbi:phosphate ABC transporter substrate-binding protein PstS [Herbiconiux sp. 11R-BC]|uniref:phosphate ABC transporter substrate-binding protein PstS n=1 Tax=Herbiconiux sp. 11R-BC TaxID=3111637 RepID=UPI003BFAB375